MSIKPHPTWDILDMSKLGCYMKCPRKYFGKYILGLQSNKPSIHLVFGKGWHLGMEHLLLTDYSIANVNKAHELFMTEYAPVYGDPYAVLEDDSLTENWEEINSPKNASRARDAYIAYTANYIDDHKRFTVLDTEVGVALKVGKVRVVGRMDSIIYRPGLGVSSLEHKSGGYHNDLWNRGWDLHFQPAFYSMIIKNKFADKEYYGIEMNGSFFHRVKDNFKAEKFDFQRYLVHHSDTSLKIVLDNMLYWVGKIKEEHKLLACGKNCFAQNNNSCASYGKLCSFHPMCMNNVNLLGMGNFIPDGFVNEYWNPLADATKEKLYEIKL